MVRREKLGRRPSAPDPLPLEAGRPTRLQRRALEVLETAHARLANCPAWHRRGRPLTMEEVEALAQDPQYDGALSDWARAVLRAARAGVLSNRELVESSHAVRISRDRIRDWQAQGQRDFLARARIGLGRRVKPPLNLEEIRRSNAIREKMEDRKYPTLEAARRALIRQGLIPKMTKQSFLRLVDRFELRVK